MTTFGSNFFGRMRHYAGKLQTLRNDARTERFLNSLPEEIRRDIGWPDIHTVSRRGNRLILTEKP
ncbi:hypothetical protein ABFT80_03605 [Mesorhizobium sp. SB112]|jgi:hypothetical protein|uniref:hypothetical protein n=1 Tax=Mesorhizobium sp. SB112 TaxID=3151853 RepID=UPI0032649109